MVTSSKILSRNSQDWESDHSMTEITMAGPLALRDFTRKTFQKETYDMKGLEGEKTQMRQALKEWVNKEYAKGEEGLWNLNRVLYQFMKEAGLTRKKKF